MSDRYPWNLSLILFLSVVLSMVSACSRKSNSDGHVQQALSATMKAVRIHEYGDLSTLRYEDAPRPRPGEGELLIRVHAAAVNPVDVAQVKGALRDELKYTLPITPGWDVSGVVEEVGPSVTRFRPGDAVFSYYETRDGSFAEYMVVHERDAAAKPKSVDHVQAAAVPLTGLTAYQALVETAQIKEGQRVLIHGGAGGVGTMAIQIAKARGAHVIATASARNLEYLKSLGADEVIDYEATRFEDVVKDVDVVLDTVGKDTQQRSWKVLAKGGFLVSIKGVPSAEKARELGVRASRVGARPEATQLQELAQLIDAGKIRPVVSEILPLKDARRALEQIKTAHTRGKVVLRVVESP